MTVNNVVMWETQLNIVDWVYSKTDFAGDFEHSKSTSYVLSEVEHLRKKQKKTSVSRSSIESDTLSLDAGLRMDDLWDVEIEVLHSSNERKSSTQGAAGHCALTSSSGRPQSKRKGRRANTGKPSTRRNPKHKSQNETETMINCQTWITWSQTQVLLNVNRSCRFFFLKTMRL